MKGAASDTLIDPRARSAIAETIRAAGGNEVFFLGKAEGGLVVSVEDFCRGNDHMVPVLKRAARGFDVAIHNHPSGDLTPSDPDLVIAAELADLGLAFYIVDAKAERVNPVVKLIPREAPPPPLDGDAAARMLAADGPVARLLGDAFEAREEQGRMARLAARAFTEGELAVIEAGTGTGKSLAYLVPALLRALEAKERIVVSTATINLQEQLVTKDIPLLQRAWPGIAAAYEAAGRKPLPKDPPRVVLLKGRSNYACLRKAEEVAEIPEETFESKSERDEALMLASWAQRSREGTREELTAPPTAAAWERVSVDADTCTRTACRRYAECHYFRARREAAQADLIVANHHLLLSDLAVRREVGWKQSAVLPPWRHVVLDEAHHLEDVAGEHLGAQVTSNGLRRALGRLLGSARRERGLLPGLRMQLSRQTGDVFAAAARVVDEQAIPRRIDVDARVDRLFDALHGFLLEAGARAGDEAQAEAAGFEAPITLRVRHHHQGLESWRQVAEDAKEAASALRLVGVALEAALRPLEDALEGKADLEGTVLETKAAALRLDRAAAGLQGFVEEEDPRAGLPREVRWIERRPSRRGEILYALRKAPLEVAPALAQDLWPHVGGAVLCSATLAVSGSFEYLKSRVGLEPAPAAAADASPERRKSVLSLRLPSPFAYEEQSVLGLPQDLPDPAERSYDQAAAEALLRLAQASRGRAFFLFTSYRALERTYRRLEGALRAEGLTPLRQGEAARGRLIERFRAEAPCVLFGTDSFWEGVDVGGGALKLVAIQRLPFKVPSEPLQEARAEAIEARGGDPFREMTVPQAVLKLKQGFGRLIRSRRDRGAIVILDRRVTAKSYGRLFLESLPPARRVRGTLAEVLVAVERATGA